MKTLSRSIRLLVGSFAVYAALATAHGCGPSPSSGGTGGAASSAHGGGAGHGSTSSTGAGPVPDAFADSGSRLRVKWTTADDGARSFEGFYDSLRKEDCAWKTLVDGKLHCAPTAAWARVPGALNADFFADDKCTMRFVSGKPCDGPPLYVTTPEPGCAGAQHIFVAGAKLNISMSYLLDQGQCVGAGMLPASLDAYAIGVEVPPSAFVAATVVTE